MATIVSAGLRSSLISISQVSISLLKWLPMHHGVYDIALLVELGIAIELSALKSSEYSMFSLRDVNSLKSLDGNEAFVPTRRALLSALTDGAGRFQLT
jgi:hypothetical protein